MQARKTGMLTVLSIVLLLNSNLPVVSEGGSAKEAPMVVGFGEFSIEGGLTTGDSFVLSINATDNAGVSEARLVYDWSQGAPQSPNNHSMNGTGDTFSITLTNPPNSLLPLWVKAAASNSTGAWNETPWRTFQIADNDPPSFISDGSTEAPTTGDGYYFITNMDDNIGIYRAFLNVTVGSAGSGLFPMCGAGNTRQTLMVIPYNATGVLSYRFEFEDQAGNHGESHWIDKSIIDNDPPLLIEDLTGGSPTTGEQFEIRLHVTDNIRVIGYFIEYAIEGFPPINVSMGRTMEDNYTHTIGIPSSASGNLTYRCVFNDESGNFLVTRNRTIPVLDNDPPYLIQQMSDSYAMTGDDFNFQFYVGDNIRISKALVTYGYVMEDKVQWVTAELERASRASLYIYQRTIKIKEELTAEYSFRYYLLISDAGGNIWKSAFIDVPLVDNDEPGFFGDLSDVEGYSGEPFHFELIAGDNVGVWSASVFIRMEGHVEERIMTLGPSNGKLMDFYLDFNVPMNFSGNMSYWFEVEDLSGNVFKRSPIYVGIKDTIQPYFHSISFIDRETREIVDELTTGEQFDVIVRVKDNIAIGSVDLMFRTEKEDYYWEIELSVDRKYISFEEWVGSFIAPPYGHGNMTYRIWIRDTGMNVLDAGPFFINVLDNDLPDISDLDHPSEIGCSRIFNITFRVLENSDDLEVKLTSSPGIEVVEGPIRSSSYFFTCRLRSLEGPIGPVSLFLRASDPVGFVEERMVIVLVDDIDPEITLEYESDTMGYNHPVYFRAEVRENDAWEVESVVASGPGTSFEIVDYTVSGDRITGSFVPTNTGPWSLIVTVLDPSGNMGTRSVSLNVIDRTPPHFAIDIPDTAVKQGDEVVLKVKDLLDAGEPLSIEWRIFEPGGKVLTAFNSTEFRFRPKEHGSYKIDVTITDPSGNSRHQTVWLEVEQSKESGGISWFLWLLVAIGILAALAAVFALLRERIMGGSEKGKGSEGEPIKKHNYDRVR
ncbi:MAG: PKD domain-containing protein [Thermoplasmatota archaeon]